MGAIGHLAAFSFHETKNLISGEGGMLAINDPRFMERAEIIWEKGTNRSAFFRGEVDKYNWVDIGSSFLPSEIIAAFLWAQLENLNKIQKKRLYLWDIYNKNLKVITQNSGISLPVIPSYATNNGHMFYLVCSSNDQRTKIISALKEKDILAVFHYLSLNKSPYYKRENEVVPLQNSDRYSDQLLRLPLYYELKETEIEFICEIINETVKDS